MNKRVPFLIQQPKGLENDVMGDNIAFYNNIVSILQKWRCPYKILPVKLRGLGKVPESHEGILLAHHTAVSRPNLWNLKKGYIPFYMNFDRCGFSGWSEMAKSKKLFSTSQKVDAEQATQFVNSFRKTYSAKDVSKYPQSKSTCPDEPFLFVACQRPQDVVSQLAQIETYELASQVAHQLSQDINIVIKLHPKEIKQDVINHLADLPNVQFSGASIHQLISKSVGVVTVNSGVGFEALFYGKHVFTSGHVDYHWVTHKLSDKRHVANIPEILSLPVDIDRINKFLFYMMNTHFAKADDILSVEQHLRRAIDEHQRT